MSTMIEQVIEALPVQGPVLIPLEEAGVVRVVIFEQVLVTIWLIHERRNCRRNKGIRNSTGQPPALSLPSPA